MKKYIIFLLLVLIPSFTFAQFKIKDDNVESPNMTRATITGSIDSLVTMVSGNYSYSTFYVSIPSTKSYNLRFWLMGYKNVISGDYSKYSLIIDGVDTGKKVGATVADWHFAAPENNTVFSLAEGQHQICLRGTKSDIPNVETMSVFWNSFSTNNPSQGILSNYQYGKIHHSYNMGMIWATPEYREINFNPSDSDLVAPPSLFHGEQNKAIFYTFYRLEFFEQGETVSIITDTLGQKDHFLHLISLEYPATLSWVTSSIDGHATLNVTISQTGLYYVLVRAMQPEDWGTCNLTINGIRKFENVPIVNHITGVQTVNSDWSHTCYAVSKYNDPMIWLINNSNQIINYNDNYPYHSSISSFNWNKNARLNFMKNNNPLLSNMKVLATLAKSYKNGVISYTDVYAGCRLGAWTYWSDFPLLKFDDCIYTGAVSNKYNCAAWAMGEWSGNLFFSNLYGPNHNNQLHSVEILDSVFALYGYTRSGATEANSQVDLWAIEVEQGWDCSHLSVKAKAHSFASGYDWESKLGGSFRIQHPRYGLEEGYYGNVVAHYRDSTSNGLVIIDNLRRFENVSFSKDEYVYIQEKIASLPNKVIDDFTELYEICNNDGKSRLNLFIDVFQTADGYDELIEMCNCYSDLQYLIFKKINEGDILAIQLMEDLVAKHNMELFRKVFEENSKRKETENGYRIFRTLQTNSMLFVKAYLAEREHEKFQAKSAITYSDEEMFNLHVNGRSLSITVKASSHENVSVTVANLHGSLYKELTKNNRIGMDSYEFNTNVPSAGIYVVSVVINGHIYERTVKVS